MNKKSLCLSMLGDSTNIRPGHENEYRDVLARAASFFKHADRDTQEVWSFSPESTTFSLLDLYNLYQRLAAETRPLMRLLVLQMGNTLSKFVFVEAVGCGDTSHRDWFN